jgi:hypothetical protein
MENEAANLEALQNLLVELPPRRLKALLDFGMYLKGRGIDPQEVDFSWDWSDEDMEDVTLASLRYFDEQEDDNSESDASKTNRQED